MEFHWEIQISFNVYGVKRVTKISYKFRDTSFLENNWKIQRNLSKRHVEFGIHKIYKNLRSSYNWWKYRMSTDFLNCCRLFFHKFKQNRVLQDHILLAAQILQKSTSNCKTHDELWWFLLRFHIFKARKLDVYFRIKKFLIKKI